jgi:hypothetical protein
MNYDSMYPQAEPEPDPQQICYTVVDPFVYLLMTFGAGVGYFMMGGFLSFICCERNERENNQIILANPITI